MNRDDEDFCNGTSLEFEAHRWRFIGNIVKESGLFDSMVGLWQCIGCKRIKLGERQSDSGADPK